MKLALVGAGARGMIYSRYAHDKLGDDIVAVADRHPEKLERAHRLFGTPGEMLFTDPLELIRTVPEADALIVASMDRDHYAHAMAGLDRGWHLLLEKPISPDPLECLKISRKATEMGLSVTVCHVLKTSGTSTLHTALCVATGATVTWQARLSCRKAATTWIFCCG